MQGILRHQIGIGLRIKIRGTKFFFNDLVRQRKSVKVELPQEKTQPFKNATYLT